jgi:hypothetical protein
MEILKALGVRTKATFVPKQFPAEVRPTLNWTVEVYRGDRLVLTTPFDRGCAHAPSYCGRCTLAVRDECETGFVYGTANRRVPDPPAADVVHALLLDAGGSDAPFEEWAENLGLDTDSRRAEAQWKACREVAAALRHAFSPEELKLLADAFSAY